MIQKETIPLPLVFILLFYSGTIIALQALFPVLKEFFPQTIFASSAILLSAISFFTGNASFKLERIQKLYVAYFIVAILGLYRSAEVGCLTQGAEVVSTILKHLIFIVILASFTRTLPALAFSQKWILITCGLFVLHSIKAIFAGHTGLGGRFDNYVGLISNADYIGVFVATFAVIFFHIALQSLKTLPRLFWFILGIFSVFIMVKTHTRSAVLVLAVLIPWWIVITSTSIAEFFKKGIVICAIIATFFIVGNISSSDSGSYFARISTISRSTSNDADFNTKSRLFMWKQGLGLGWSNALLGVGSGAAAPYLELNFQGVELKNKQSKFAGFSMHNTMIEIFAERGIIGIVLFIMVLLFTYRNFNVVALAAREHPDLQQLVILADVGRLYLVGYIVSAMFNTIDYDWTLHALIALAISSQQYMLETVSKRSVRKDNSVDTSTGNVKSTEEKAI